MQPERAFLSSPQSGIHFVPVKTSNFSGGNSPAILADPGGCGSHARPKSPRKVLNLKVGRPLDRVLALEVLNPGPEGAVATHLLQKKCAADGPNLIAQIAHPISRLSIARARARERQVFRARAESPNAAGGTSGLTDPLLKSKNYSRKLCG